MRENRIIILAGGYSIKEQNVDFLELKKRGILIGVNDSMIHMDCDIGVSMDRLWMESRVDWLEKNSVPVWLRETSWNINLKNRIGWPGLYFFKNDHKAEEFSDEPDTLNGFNSGVCAINLAYHFKPKEIYLFGFDMTKEKAPQPYWYPPYDWPEAKPEGNTSEKRYKEWADSFDLIAEQLASAGIWVYNVSPDSALDNFQKLNYQEFLRKVPCAKSH